MSKVPKISTFHLILLATGGMVGSGWLFAPFYGFQTAGVWVILSWIVTAVLTLIIALAFAEVSTMLPIVGGISRFIGITHNRTMAFIFIFISWLSYVVYLPLEAQSTIQYLGFFMPILVTHTIQGIELSRVGILLAIGIILGLTWFNCLIINTIVKTNSWVSLWKLIIPFAIGVFFIVKFGKWDFVVNNYKSVPLSLEAVLLAVTSSGLAFAFSGFQNGLILANNAQNPKRALPYSLFVPIILGVTIYIILSLVFIFCTVNASSITSLAVAPLLGLVALFGIHILYIILFVDAIGSPLGTANVFTAVTGRILYGLGKVFMPKRALAKLNAQQVPATALWINGIIGIGFLLPFPTWKQLVDFLSSILVFAYLAGPIALIVLRLKFPDLQRNFKTKCFLLVGYAGFACCGLLIYWSGLINLVLIVGLLIILSIGMSIFDKQTHALTTFKQSFMITLYMIVLMLVSYAREKNVIAFPADNLLIIGASIIFCYILVKNSLSPQAIGINLEQVNQEIQADNQ